MDIKIPDEVKMLLEKFQQSGYQIYIVGGAIRDLIRGKEVNDWDFTTDAKPEEILKLFPEGFYDNKFGTVGIPFDFARNGSEERSWRTPAGNEMSEAPAGAVTEDIRRDTSLTGPQIFEVTTMRKEGDYRDFRHPVEVSWTNKIEEDLARRDFSINALALGVESRIKTLDSSDLILVDPFNGQQDIEQKIIRAVGDPNQRFKEDALRLMRAIRIATQLNFQIGSQTFQAIQTNAQLIKQIAYERIRDELFKILATENPLAGIELLKKTGILEIILPELVRTFGIVQEGPRHDRIYDIGEHSFLSLKHCPSKDPLVRFAVLLHDVGKPDTMDIQEDSNITFYNHDLVGGKIVLEIAKRFNLSKKQTDKLYKLVRWHLFTVDEHQTDSAIRRFIKNVSLENIDDMMAVRIGDRLGGGTQKAVSWRMEKFQQRIKQVLEKPFSIADLKINGNDVMKELNLKPGPKVGEILQKLFEEVMEDNSKNNREYLMNRIKNLE